LLNQIPGGIFATDHHNDVYFPARATALFVFYAELVYCHSAIRPETQTERQLQVPAIRT
jgi:hypothetical protein